MQGPLAATGWHAGCNSYRARLGRIPSISRQPSLALAQSTCPTAHLLQGGGLLLMERRLPLQVRHLGVQLPAAAPSGAQLLLAPCLALSQAQQGRLLQYTRVSA